MATSYFAVNGVEMPTPSSISADQEYIWSSDTGRTMTAETVGTIVGEKKNVTIGWRILTDEQLQTVINALNAHTFFPVYVINVGTFTCYRGKIQRGNAVFTQSGLRWQNPSVYLVEK